MVRFISSYGRDLVWNFNGESSNLSMIGHDCIRVSSVECLKLLKLPQSFYHRSFFCYLDARRCLCGCCCVVSSGHNSCSYRILGPAAAFILVAASQSLCVLEEIQEAKFREPTPIQALLVFPACVGHESPLETFWSYGIRNHRREGRFVLPFFRLPGTKISGA